MKKRGKVLVILALTLCVLIGGYYVIDILTRETPAETAQPLLNLSADNLSRITWIYNGTSVTLLHGTDGWALEGSAAFPLDTDQVSTMTGVLQNLTATNTITEPAALSEYGLENPSVDLTLELSDGTSTELKIGDYNQAAGLYYLLWNGNVYTVTSAVKTAFAKSLCDLAIQETIPSFEDVSALTIDDGDSQTVLRHAPDGKSELYTDAFRWFAKTGTGEEPADAQKVENYLSTLDVTWQKCVAWNATDDELATYGLDSTASSVSVDYTATETVDTGNKDSDGNPVTQTVSTDKNFTLLLGAECDGARYARLEGSRMVYTLASSDCSELLSADSNSLKPDTLMTLDWDEVTAFELHMNGQTITVMRSDDSWLCRGTGLNSTLADNLKSAITGLSLTDTAGVAEDAPAITGTIYQDRDGFPQLDFSLTGAGESWLGAFQGTTVPVESDSVQTLCSAIQAVLDSFTANAAGTSDGTTSNASSGTTSGTTGG
ncbi:MAG: DUF4340 domain-containing protein [Clostridiaceae bacterium]|nr:DUF4340 domain-containing protein [Clostridiaceae bacterium]